MCNAAAALSMQGAGAASSAVGAYYGAKSSKNSLDLQANLADINAASTLDMVEINAASVRDTVAINSRLAEGAAQSTLLTGQRQEQQSRISTANLKGTQRASMAANGIDLGAGTAVQVLTSTDAMGEVDAATIQSNAVRSAWGYRTQSVLQNNQMLNQSMNQTTQAKSQAMNQTNQALMSRASAGAISPLGSATTSLLGSAGSVAGNWYQYNKAGVK